MGKFGRNGRFVRVAYGVGLIATCLSLAACANGNVASSNVASSNVASSNVASNTSHEPDAAARAPMGERVAKAVQRAPKPAVVVRHAPLAPASYSTVGTASWYGPGFHGRRTANGETFDMNSLTAAHPTLPLQSQVRVTNLANQRSLVLRVNDRGPYVGHRVIDVSAKSAQLLGFYGNGLAKVKVEYIGRARPAAEHVTASAASP